MNILLSQQSIVEHLAADFTSACLPFLSRDLPDTSREYENGLVIPIAYVVYSGSTASGTVTSNTIAQPRKVRFSVECYGRTLYRANGLFVLRDVVEQSLVGFKPTNCQRLYLLSDEISQTDDKIWVHVYQFECETMLVQKDESEPIIIPSFQELIPKES